MLKLSTFAVAALLTGAIYTSPIVASCEGAGCDVVAALDGTLPVVSDAAIPVSLGIFGISVDAGFERIKIADAEPSVWIRWPQGEVTLTVVSSEEWSRLLDVQEQDAIPVSDFPKVMFTHKGDVEIPPSEPVASLWRAALQAKGATFSGEESPRIVRYSDHTVYLADLGDNQRGWTAYGAVVNEQFEDRYLEFHASGFSTAELPISFFDILDEWGSAE
ncbi:hypothetical protein CAI21_08450 [Alkalilimnicola ehrlichii]|uniref:Uncharacterized protein n=1 Tax=Alkalilimnicola ehrlichii TaxID=351052 RepID=A0A3E0WW83_9GAMM|nr:hypothetical protein [Alkalilimnicola ehrlichii]RFA29855.1 hypothetical protein CAI21_08450 [Alkalilimnicola ehrlichii]RFA36443.1 hypothetical protein CAL65_10715 [Alkalilimnicola ehrlichii]